MVECEKQPAERLEVEVQYASERNKKGRAMGGMVIGIRRRETAEASGIEVVEEGIVTGSIRMEEKWWIVGIYVREDIERKLEKMKRWLEGKREEEVKVIIGGGDFNARTGEAGGKVVLGEEEDSKESKKSDEKINKKGERLTEMLKESGWSIINENVKGDEEGEYTFTGGKGNTVIDYVTGNEEIRERIERLEIGEDTDSDHHPLICWMKGEYRKKREGRIKQGKKRGV